MMRKIFPSESPIHSPFDKEMFCHRDEAHDHPSHSTVTVHLLSKSSAQEQLLRKHKAFNSLPKIFRLENLLEAKTSQEEDAFVGGWDSYESNRSATLKLQRSRLEKDVFRLEKQLQQEVDLHYALETVSDHAAGTLPNFPGHLPKNTQELLADIAMLEMTISNLEDQMVALNLQLGYEQGERMKAEHRFLKFPLQDEDQATEIMESPSSCLNQAKEATMSSSSNSGRSYNWSASARCSTQHPCSTLLTEPSSPRICAHFPSLYGGASTSSYSNTPVRFLTSPSKQASQQNLYSDDESGSQNNCLVQSTKLGCKHSWMSPGLLSPEKMKCKHSASPTSRLHGEMMRDLDIRNSWQQPNRLSQEMVHCMVSIYRHLADTADTSSSTRRIPSPTSPYEHLTSSSLSSLSESSFWTFTNSPLVDVQSKELALEKPFGPYRTPEKLPWADIGSYSTAIEVSEMCVGKEQLEYAAEALRMFRSLVEQLSRIDPSSMRHEEKLAFWINVYNALMMHAYLAYGVPKDDFKFFSLMQKAAYTVGGHSFNAVIIEHLLLKGKAPWYRPQIASLLAHQKLKLRDEVSMFAIDRVEPLVTFSLSFGATSSPAVRVYTAENVHEELQIALQDYVRASVGINAKGKLLVPKLLHDFLCGLVEESAILDWICQFLPCPQSSLIRNCVKHRQHKFLNSKTFAVIPFDFRFRYLFLLGKGAGAPHRKS